MISNAYHWIVSNWGSIAAVAAGLLSLVGTLKNLFQSKPKIESVLDHIADVLAWASAPGTLGVIGRASLPGIPSRAPANDGKLKMLLPFLFVGVASVTGCGGYTAAQIGSATLAGGIDVVQCAPEEYAAFKNAAQQGGTAWVGAAFDALHCAGSVFNDVMGALKHAANDMKTSVAYDREIIVAPNPDGDVDLDQLIDRANVLLSSKLASNAAGTGELAPEGWSKHGLKRLTRMYRMYRALYGAK